MKQRLRQLIAHTTESATWLLFAKAADDRRRRAYWNVLGRLRRRDIRQRVAMLKMLPTPIAQIPPAIGFSRCHLEDFGSSDAVVAEVLRIVSERGAAPVGSKPYLMDTNVCGLDRSSALLRFALDPVVLATVAGYLGMTPRLVSIAILESRAQPGTPSGSQLFHSDYEDVRQVKIFLNCSDVRSENGPLHVIPAQQSRRVKDAIGYKYGGAGFRVPDSVVAGLLPSEEIIELTGPPGAVTFIDTSSCFHYGSRIQPGAEGRLVVQFQYLTPAAFELVIAPSLRHPAISRSRGADPLERAVLGRN
jgi:hypothetical protein